MSARPSPGSTIPHTHVHTHASSTRSPRNSRTTRATTQTAVPASTTLAVSTCSGGGAGRDGWGTGQHDRATVFAGDVAAPTVWHAVAARQPPERRPRGV